MSATTPGELSSAIRDAVRDELQPLFQDLRTFVDRRIAELSAEVNGAVQMVDYSENNIAGQITRLQEELQRMVAVPSAATRNSGLELEAVVQVTETAANQILEAAEAIGNWVQDGSDLSKVAAVTDGVNAIFEACSFQDLTGQRVRRAIQHLQQVESMLNGIKSGAPVEAAPTGVAADMAEARASAADLDQDAIDKLLA